MSAMVPPRFSKVDVPSRRNHAPSGLPVMEMLESRLLLSAPAAPSLPDLLPAYDSGFSNADDITNIATPTINIASTAAGATVRIYRNGTALDKGTFLGNATFVSGTTYQYVFTAGQLQEGEQVIQARAWDGVAESDASPSLILDLDTTPDVPVVGSFFFPGSTPPSNVASAQGVAVVGSLAYVADFDHGLKILDISTPSAPALLGTYDTPGNALGVAVQGSVAYVADGTSLQLINITTPSSPSFLGSIGSAGFAFGVTVSGSLAYVADQTGGLRIIDVSTPASPTLAGSYDTPGFALEVELSGSLAFVADTSTLQIINVSTPGTPTLAGSYTASGDVEGVTVVGSLAYLAAGYGGLEIVNVGTPGSPSLVGSGHTIDYAARVAVSGSRAYVVDLSGGLEIFDISTPATPTLVREAKMPAPAFDLALAGPLIYVADGDSGLQIVDDELPVIDLQAGSDSGVSTTDNITNDTTPTFDVTKGLTYSRIYRNGALVSPDFGTSPITLGTQPEGTYDFTAKSVDLAGNVSAPSAAVNVVIDATAPKITDVTVNGGLGDRSVSQAVSPTKGVTLIQVTFNDAVSFDDGDVVLNKVTFPGGVETLGAAVVPSALTAVGNSIMGINLTNGSAVDTWIKVGLEDSITDLAGNALDGEAPAGGSGRGYLFSRTLDLPSGNGTAGGDAIFVVGSLIGDITGNAFVNISDGSQFSNAWLSHAGDANYNAKADFTSNGFVNISDGSQLSNHWLDKLDTLPTGLAPLSLSGGELLGASNSEGPALVPTGNLSAVFQVAVSEPVAPAASTTVTADVSSAPAPLITTVTTDIIAAAPSLTVQEPEAEVPAPATTTASLGTLSILDLGVVPTPAGETQEAPSGDTDLPADPSLTSGTVEGFVAELGPVVGSDTETSSAPREVLGIDSGDGLAAVVLVDVQVDLEA